MVPFTEEITLAAAIRLYFDVVLCLLIFTGFGTLASTGRLDLATVIIVTSALLYRGYALARRQEVLLSERWTNILTIACVGFYIADDFFISRAFLGATVHLVLFVMLVRLFSAQKDRDHYFLAVLSFLMVLAAAVLTVDSTFLIALAGFVPKLRGVALSNFDGRSWSNRSDRQPIFRGPDGRFNLELRNIKFGATRGHNLHYRVIMEPFITEVFFLLATPESLAGNYRAVSENPDGSVFNLDNEHPVARYEADSRIPAPIAVGPHSASDLFRDQVSSEYLHVPELDPR